MVLVMKIVIAMASICPSRKKDGTQLRGKKSRGHLDSR